MKISPRVSFSLLRLAFVAALLGGVPAARAESGWESIFDGKTLNGWKASEHPDSVRVVDGMIYCDGPRAHLFYLGADGQAQFENFELELDVKAMPGANSGVYFGAKWLESGWPTNAGFEVQVNNDQPLFEKNYIENKKTGSLYGVRNVYKAMVKDNEWFTMNIRVQRPRVEIRLNGRTVVTYTEPTGLDAFPAGAAIHRLGAGTFALQCHDEKSQVWYRNIRVRRLPPGEDTAVTRPVFNAQDAGLAPIAKDNFPLVDLRVHLADGFSLADIEAIRNRTGIFSGILARGAADAPVHDDATAEAFVAQLRDEPVFAGLAVAGDEWLRQLTPTARARFDYIITDVTAWADQQAAGAPEQAFMDRLTERIEWVMANTPVDVFANVTYLPESLASRSDRLWTEERLQRIVAAAVKNGVALEISPRLKLPGAKFIKLAKGAGARFTVGSGSSRATELGDWAYVLEIQQQAGLSWRNMYVPGHEPTRAQRALKN